MGCMADYGIIHGVEWLKSKKRRGAQILVDVDAGSLEACLEGHFLKWDDDRLQIWRDWEASPLPVTYIKNSASILAGWGTSS